MKASQLFGRWAVRYSDPPSHLPATAILVLERHAEFSDSLAGTVTRPAQKNTAAVKAALAGDLDAGLLLLDESSDNIRITATWNAEALPGSCGNAFQGEWRDTSTDIDAPTGVPFTLTRIPSVP